MFQLLISSWISCRVLFFRFYVYFQFVSLNVSLGVVTHLLAMLLEVGIFLFTAELSIPEQVEDGV